jgi:hypothetical protein
MWKGGEGFWFLVSGFKGLKSFGFEGFLVSGFRFQEFEEFEEFRV